VLARTAGLVGRVVHIRVAGRVAAVRVVGPVVEVVPESVAVVGIWAVAPVVAADTPVVAAAVTAKNGGSVSS
jgi:hypothetical protein